ncbi:MAG: hypothetical protein ACK4MM_05705, partial [Fervidobacterium sp.]
MLKKGSLLIEALVAILIISMAVGISMVSSYNLTRKVYENKMVLDMVQVLLNQCEEVLATNSSKIFDTTKTVSYGSNQYTVNISKIVNISPKFKFYRHVQNTNTYTLISKPSDVVIQNITIVKIKVT